MALLTAVMEAQRWCDDMKNRAPMCSIVAGRQYINVPVADSLFRYRDPRRRGPRG